MQNSGAKYLGQSRPSMDEKEKRMHCCCFTGHRPEKLNRSEREIKLDLMQEIQRAIDDGFTVFITGMARGVDIWAAEIIIQLKENGFPLRLICALPHPNVERKWNIVWQKRYSAILEAADLVRCISPHYSWNCYQMRNEWMVNHSARVIAVFNGQNSGTKNTIDYALQLSVPVRQIKG